MRHNEKGEFVCRFCELELRLENEPRIPCPEHGCEMEKEVKVLQAHPMLIDRCPLCKGVWLQPGELEMLEAYFEENGSNSYARHGSTDTTSFG